MNLRIVSIAMVAAHHYKLMKKVVTEIRAKESERISVEEAHMADYLVGIMQALGGKRLASYCQERFHRGVVTGDLRSYKVKFVMVKLRDMLPPGEAKSYLESELEKIVAHAEVLAGCKPDSKRRNRKAREEMAARKAEKKAAREAMKEAMKEAGRSSGGKGEDADGDNTSKPSRSAAPRRSRPSRPQSVDELADEIESKEYGREDDPDEDQGDYDDGYRGGERYTWHSSYGGYGKYDSTGFNWDPDGE